MRFEDRIRTKLEECGVNHRYLVELRDHLLKEDADFVVWGAVERYLQFASSARSTWAR